MSSYIVSNATMNYAIAAWMTVKDKVERFYAQFGLTMPPVPEDGTELGQILFELNGAAVDARYKTIASGDAQAIPYRYKPPRTDADGHFQMHMSLSNLIYQCAEHGADDKPLFKLLQVAQMILANDLLRFTAESARAKWDLADR
jgi:hypothetical protein